MRFIIYFIIGSLMLSCTKNKYEDTIDGPNILDFIEDETFKELLIEYTFEGRTYASLKDAAKVRMISTSCGNIYSLKGIDFFINVTHLTCENSELTELDLSKNINLEYLYCPNNKISTLDLSMNKKLIFVDCARNKLNNLNLAMNKDLKRLDCYNNELTTLDLSMCNKLTSLNCFDNLFKDKSIKIHKDTYKDWTLFEDRKIYDIID